MYALALLLILAYLVYRSTHRRHLEVAIVPRKISDRMNRLWEIAHYGMRENRFLRAEKALLTILKIDQKNAAAYNRLGILYAKQKEFKDAIDCFEIASSIEPTASSLHNLGLIYYETENYHKAASAFEQALKLEDELAARHIAYAKVQEKLGNEKLLLQELERAAGLEPKPREIGTPFLLDHAGAEVGIVLSHGYLAAPAEVRGLASYLHSAGFTVYCPRLSGHGTVPTQLDTSTWRDWQASYDRGFAILKHRCRHVIVAGFSAGALLALAVAARRAPCVIGCLAINPALHLSSAASRLVPGVMAWNDLLRVLHIRALRHEWVVNRPQYPDVNYTLNPLRAVRELLRLERVVDRRLGDITVPTLVLQADQDPVVDPRFSQRLVERLAADEVDYAPMAFTHHGILRGEGCEVVFERITEWARTLAHRVRSAQPHPLPR